jgi:D-alanyl-D-alanine carboxypeptidase
MKRMLAKVLVVMAMLAGRVCCGQDATSPSAPSPEVAKKLQERLNGFVSQPNVVNYVALVDGGPTRWRWAGAAGIADPQTDEKMTVEHQFRVASVTKTFTAVVILQLMEEGRLSLDTTLATLMNGQLPGGYAVNDLHSAKEKLGDTITVRQLLSHTSGLPDNFFEPATAGDHVGLSVCDLWLQVLLNPGGKGATKQWSPNDIIADYFKSGLPAKAKFSPGSGGINYADTNFVLLALAAEKLTGKSLAENYRERILDRLGMEHTYLEWYEPKRGDRLAHHFVNLDYKGGGNVDVVAAKLNTSADWAGSGLVSTVEDLNVFVRAIFSGKLFQHKATLKEMTKPLGTLPDGNEYCLGLTKSVTECGQHAYWGHGGLWGAGMFYCPASTVSVVFCRNQPGDIGKELSVFHETLDDVGLFR